ncbi:MAG: hypothetical protein NC086_09700 [Alistipes sp.]|nr:hypothetical protein [Alistipes sp.]
MKFKNMPVILALIAGFIVCMATFIYRYEGISWLWLVIGAIALFYGLGLCLRKLFNVILAEEIPEEEKESDNDADAENTENEDTESEAEENEDGQ